MVSLPEGTSSKLRRTERGYTLVFVAMGLLVLMGSAGICFDVGYLEDTQRQMQTAADAAATAGAQEIVRGDFSGLASAAQVGATSNGFTNGTSNITVTINNPPLSGYYAGNTDAVEAIITQAAPTFFMRAFNISTATVYARAVASQVTSPNCVFALDPSMADALEANNDADVKVGCGVIDDSSSSSAAFATGSASINATGINVVGGYSNNNNGSFSPTPKTGVLPITDPLAAIPAPTVGSCTQTDPNWGQLGGQTITLYQGTYCGSGLDIENGMKAIFTSGTYIISGNGMHIAGGSTVTGSNVMFYITKGNGYSFAPLIIDNGTTVTLSAPTTGTYAGILFFQDRSITTANTSNSATSLAGGANMTLTGAIYTPGTQLDVSNGTNTSASYTIIVADSILFQGGITLNANYSGLQGGSPIQVATLGE